MAFEFTFRNFVIAGIILWVLSYVFSDDENRIERGYGHNNNGRRALRSRQPENGVPLIGGNGGKQQIVEVDEFGENRVPVYSPINGKIVEGPVKEYDTIEQKEVIVEHHGVDTTKTEYENVKKPIIHPSVPYETTEMIPVTVTVPQPPIQKTEFKNVTISVPTAPFTKVVKRPFTYWHQPPPLKRIEMRPVHKVHQAVPYSVTEVRPVSITVQPPPYKTTETKKIPIFHPPKTYFTQETVFKPVNIKVPHVKPGFTTTKLEHYERIHHQAPVTKTKFEKFNVTKYKPPYVTTEMRPFTEEIVLPGFQKIGYKNEEEVIKPPPHLETHKEPYNITIPQPNITETKVVPEQVTRFRPPYTTFVNEQVAHKVPVPGKNFTTAELVDVKVHHKLEEQKQVVAESGPVKYLGPAVGRPQIFEQDVRDYATRCLINSDCPKGACGLQYSSEVGGDVRVCCPSGRVTAADRCVPL